MKQVNEKTALALRDKAKEQLAKIKDIETGVAYLNKVRAIEVWAKAEKKDAELQTIVAEQKIRTQRILGRLIQKGQERGEIASQKTFRGNRYKGLDSNLKELSKIGISKKQSSTYQTIASVPNKQFEAIITEKKKTIDGAIKELTTKGLVDEIKKQNKDKIIEKEKKARGTVIAGLDIRRGDFKEVLTDLYEIDAIITDPPYPAEYLDCFEQLAEYAAEHLKQDGFVAAYSGQYHLPDVIERMTKHLTYVWTFCLYHVGQKQLVNGVNIMCGWKPVLIFSRGKKKMRYSAYDVLTSEKKEKSSHEWQQSESGVLPLIEILTKPGELVVDPFAGSGTFLKVAEQNGRRAIGAEVEESDIYDTNRKIFINATAA